MRHPLLASALVLASVALVGTGCSAVVAPDINRLGGDAGTTSQNDAAVLPGDDAAVLPGIDSGMPGVCGAGQLDCGGTCVSPASDPNHCGSCANRCAGGQSCVSGVCTGGGGTILGNPNDCGASHARCATLEVCIAGACVCRTPYMDIGGTCIDLTSDPSNCGAPGHACAGRCSNGLCITGGCSGGLTNCDGACVDLRRDPGNCDGCGNTCSGSQICVRGCRDVTVPASCTSCPCDACGGGAQCCTYPGLGAPVCIDGVDFCP